MNEKELAEYKQLLIEQRKAEFQTAKRARKAEAKANNKPEEQHPPLRFRDVTNGE